jgi:hypothetical protein
MKSSAVFLLCAFLFTGSSCRLLHLGGEKTGCPSNGKNVGAEKLLSGDPKATRDAKKAKKYKLTKDLQG